ncbi:transglycosylase SLT domain-containing protein [Nitrospira moscoviensis]|uniref:Putative Lytic transglycosylase-like protein n=1 Tax=Nitrospira moscoviensis TaxID=42253 RepID=A0A0K2GFW0_NITMO|nr:transglycosylase SLT domain-containing protein [Nitrospira moscoviensis]ALA59487.1 putative Lytic transglycosylase-like protein [Nitrospira moscoviensis]
MVHTVLVGALLVIALVPIGAEAIGGLPLSRDTYWYLNHRCVQQAAHRYHVSPVLLEAIVHVESEGNPLAVGVNRQNEGESRGRLSYTQAAELVSRLWQQGANFDVGLGQINSRNLEQYRVHPVYLLDACVNLQWAAFVLRQKLDLFGHNWVAIGRYNGSKRLTQYVWKIYRALVLLEQVRKTRR